MTTLYSNNFDTTPPADETTITIAAHTSGGAGIDGARLNNPGTNGAGIKWDSDTPHTGTRSIRVDAGSPTVNTTVNPYEFGADANQVYIRGYSRMSTLPASNSTVMGIQNSSAALQAGFQFLTSGQLRIRNGTVTVATSTRAFAAGEWFGWEWHLDAVAHTQELRVYDATYSDLRETITGAFTGVIRRFSLGNLTGWDAGMSGWWDDLVVSDSGFPGPLGGADPGTPAVDLYTNNFDTTPPADETTATTAAHTSGGAGTGAARITIGSGAGVKWDSATPHSGSRSLRVDGGNPTAFTIFNPYEFPADANKVYFRFYARVSAFPAQNATIAAIQNDTPTLTAGLQYTTSGQLRIRNGTNTVDTTTRVFAGMEWFGVEWFLDAVAHTQTMKVYDGQYSDLRDTLTGTFTGVIRRLTLGNVTGWDNGQSAWYDDIVVNADDYPGPLGGPAPVTSTGWKLLAPASSVSLPAKILLPDGAGGWI